MIYKVVKAESCVIRVFVNQVLGAVVIYIVW